MPHVAADDELPGAKSTGRAAKIERGVHRHDVDAARVEEGGEPAEPAVSKLDDAIHAHDGQAPIGMFRLPVPSPHQVAVGPAGGRLTGKAIVADDGMRVFMV